MSTRAVFTFKESDPKETYHIYQHLDGDPKQALINIKKAGLLAFKLPRYQASDYSAAFVAATKTGGGNIYLTTSFDDHGDLSYRYEITAVKGIIFIDAYQVIFSTQCKKIYTGRLDDFEEFVKTYKY